MANTNSNFTSSLSSSSSGNAMTTTTMMMMPPRKLLPPVESSFASSTSTDGSANNLNNNGSKVRPSSGAGSSGGAGMGMMGVLSSGGGATISSKPTLIATPKLRFLIMDAPRQSNLHLYIKECRRYHVTDIVRVCEPTYLGHELQQAGIALHEMAYDDGHSPPDEVLSRWLALVEERFLSNNAATTTHHSTSHSASVTPAAASSSTAAAAATTTSSSAANTLSTTAATATTKMDESKGTIAVHCVAGLGRAPVLVAIALMEYERMDAVDAVMKIRSLRRGAINETQLRYLEGYKCRTGKRGKRHGAAVGAGGGGGGEGGCGCCIL